MQANWGEGMPQDRTAGRKIGGREARGTKLRHVALGGAVAALVLCGNYSAARAGDDDVQNQSFTDKFLNTLGVHNPFDTQYEINYSERSPLVVPPTRDLPPPVSDNAKPAPDWPVDPEITKRAQAKKDEKVTPRAYDSVMEDERPLSPAELGVGHPVAAPGTPEQSTPVSARRTQAQPFQLRLAQEGRLWDVYRRAAAREPDRSATRLSNSVGG